MRRSILSLALVSAVLTVLALASAGPVAAKNHGVPFDGSYSGTCNPVGFVPPVAQFDCVVSGRASHLGSSSEESLIGVNVVTGATSGTSTLTAANGDELFLTNSGSSAPLGGGMESVSGTQTVSGGTGRFEGASGSLTVAGSINTVTGAISYTLEGSISY
jgi:hypothetical protein